MTLAFAACARSPHAEQNSNTRNANASTPEEAAIQAAAASPFFKQTIRGDITVALYRDAAPFTVMSFLKLAARRSFYRGLTFHRVVPNFVIQGGDPTGTGSGGPGYKTVNAPPKDAKYPEGTVAMAKAGNEPAGTAGSQFFIVIGKGGASLTPDYAIIGRVVEGLDVAKRIGLLPIEKNATDGRPTQAVYIVKVTVKAG